MLKKTLATGVLALTAATGALVAAPPASAHGWGGGGWGGGGWGGGFSHRFGFGFRSHQRNLNFNNNQLFNHIPIRIRNRNNNIAIARNDQAQGERRGRFGRDGGVGLGGIGLGGLGLGGGDDDD